MIDKLDISNYRKMADFDFNYIIKKGAIECVDSPSAKAISKDILAKRDNNNEFPVDKRLVANHLKS